MKEQFNEIIKSDELKDISINLVEQVLDNEISSDTLKEIPILKYLVAARSIYTSYSDRIFIKKAMKVLLEIGDINWKQRVDLAYDLNDEDESGVEKILASGSGFEKTLAN